MWAFAFYAYAVRSWVTFLNHLVDILTLKETGVKTSRVPIHIYPVFIEPEWRLGKFAKWGVLVMGLESIRASIQAIW